MEVARQVSMGKIILNGGVIAHGFAMCAVHALGEPLSPQGAPISRLWRSFVHTVSTHSLRRATDLGELMINNARNRISLVVRATLL